MIEIANQSKQCYNNCMINEYSYTEQQRVPARGDAVKTSTLPGVGNLPVRYGGYPEFAYVLSWDEDNGRGAAHAGRLTEHGVVLGFAMADLGHIILVLAASEAQDPRKFGVE